MSNKFSFGVRSIFNQKKNGAANTFYFGEVVKNNDDFDTGSIKVRIKNVDDSIPNNDDLPNCFPLLQKFFYSVPKIGETVMVFTPNSNNEYIDRVYIGPIISQPQFLKFDPHFYTSRSAFDTGLVKPQAAPSTIPESKGVYPTLKDVAIQGRGNNDIILRENDILIRGGKFVENNKRTDIKIYNKKTPGYIMIRSNTSINPKKLSEKGTITNIVSSKINLLTHDGGNPKFNLNDQTKQITDDDMLDILKNAHPLVFGDLLIEYLRLLRDAFVNHVHPYHGKKPQDLSGTNDIDKYLTFDLNSIISKNIRIN